MFVAFTTWATSTSPSSRSSNVCSIATRSCIFVRITIPLSASITFPLLSSTFTFLISLAFSVSFTFTFASRRRWNVRCIIHFHFNIRYTTAIGFMAWVLPHVWTWGGIRMIAILRFMRWSNRAWRRRHLSVRYTTFLICPWTSWKLFRHGGSISHRFGVWCTVIRIPRWKWVGFRVVNAIDLTRWVNQLVRFVKLRSKASGLALMSSRVRALWTYDKELIIWWDSVGKDEKPSQHRKTKFQEMTAHRSKHFPTLRQLVAIHELHPSIYQFHFASEVHIVHHSLLATGALVVLGQLWQYLNQCFGTRHYLSEV